MRRSSNKELPSPRVSKSVFLPDSIQQPETPVKPDDFSQAAWDIIVKAVEFVQNIEIFNLDQLLERYVGAVVKAHECACPSCIQHVRGLTEALNKELHRQTDYSGYDIEDQTLANLAINTAQNVFQHKKDLDRQERLEAWEKRGEEICELMDKYISNKNDCEGGDPLNTQERAKVRQLIAQAKIRAQARRQNKSQH
jgi:hypothetical protein